MGYLIDTGIWIAIERGRLSAADVHAVTHQAPVYLSSVNLAEIRFGIDLMSNVKQTSKAMAMLRRMRRKPMLRIGAETAEVFGALAARLAQSGRGHAFRVQDLWLAAQAIERKFTLLTGNAPGFRGCARVEVRGNGRRLIGPRGVVTRATSASGRRATSGS